MVGSSNGYLRGRRATLAALALACFAAWPLAADAAATGGGISLSPPAAPEALPPSTISKPVFPVRGPHQYWDGFGAGRGHEGVDIGSRCGTPLVAVQAGRVRFVKYHPRAGNYAVIDLAESTIDLAYMHLREPASVQVGQAVAAGQQIGLVGDTGNASGCHLHFEVWEGAYYGGGAPIDPMPFLLQWDRERKRVSRSS